MGVKRDGLVFLCVTLASIIHYNSNGEYSDLQNCEGSAWLAPGVTLS